MSKWVVSTIVGAVLLNLTAGVQPWIDAATGAFVPADIAQDVAAARLFVRRVNPYGPVIRTAHGALLGVPADQTFPFFPHPPFSLMISWPMGYLPFRPAALAWFAGTLALLFLLAALIVELFVVRGVKVKRDRQTFAMFLLLLGWAPALYNLEKGQWSIVLAVLVALSWRGLIASRLDHASTFAAAAAAVKVFPVVLGLFFLLRSLRSCVRFVATGALLTAVPLLWIGFSAFPSFLQQSRANLPVWETFPSVTLSVHAAVTRLFVGGEYATAWVFAPLLARIVEGAVIGGLIGSAAWVTWRAAHDKAAEEKAFAAWVTLLPILNPQSLAHNAVILALPFAYLATKLKPGGRAWQLGCWATALLLVSIPRQTLWSVAPPPIEPLEGLLVTMLPMWGALLLFLAVLWVDEAPTSVSETVQLR